MLKQTSLQRLLLFSTRTRVICRVFFAVCRRALITPVISIRVRASRAHISHLLLRRLPTNGGVFYTRARTRTRGAPNTPGPKNPRHFGFYPKGIAVALGLAMIFSISFSLLKPVEATPNTTINFQARPEGSDGAIVKDGNYNVEFKLYSASTGGSALWTEDYLNSASQGVRVVDGYLTVGLGSITAFPSTIPWDQSLYVTMNIGGTTTGSPTYDGEMSPRLRSLPRALRRSLTIR